MPLMLQILWLCIFITTVLFVSYLENPVFFCLIVAMASYLTIVQCLLPLHICYLFKIESGALCFIVVMASYLPKVACLLPLHICYLFNIETGAFLLYCSDGLISDNSNVSTSLIYLLSVHHRIQCFCLIVLMAMFFLTNLLTLLFVSYLFTK